MGIVVQTVYNLLLNHFNGLFSRCINRVTICLTLHISCPLTQKVQSHFHVTYLSVLPLTADFCKNNMNMLGTAFYSYELCRSIPLLNLLHCLRLLRGFVFCDGCPRQTKHPDYADIEFMLICVVTTKVQSDKWAG